MALATGACRDRRARSAQQPVLEALDQRRGEALAGLEPGSGRQAVDPPLDVEERVDPGDGLERHG